MQSKFEKERKEKTVILHNIVESEAENLMGRAEHDKEMFRSVVSALIREDVEDVEIENVFQLGKEQDKALDGGRQKPLMLVNVKKKNMSTCSSSKERS